MWINTLIIALSYALVALVAGIGFWVGWKRGVKRSSLITGISLGLIIVSYFVTPFISKAILGIQISSGGSSKPISQIIIDWISQSDSMKTMIENSESFRVFVESLPLIVLNVAVFVVMYGLVRLFGYIIYRIIASTCFKSKAKEKELGLKRHHLAGAGINTLKALLFLFIVMAPVTALFGFVDDIQKVGSAYEESEAEAEEASVRIMAEESESETFLPDINELFSQMPEMVMSGISTYNSHIFGVVGGAFGMDNLIFDNLTKITVDGEAIKFRQDALGYVEVYNTVNDFMKARNTSTGASLKNINWDKLDKTVNTLLDGGIVKGFASNLTADFVLHYEEFNRQGQFDDYAKILDAIKESLDEASGKLYFSNDIKCVYQIVSIAGREGILDILIDDSSETDGKFEEIFNEDNKETILAILDSILSMNVVKDATAPVMELVLEKAEFSEVELNDKAKVNWNGFKQDLIDIAEKVFDINENTNLTEIIDEPLSLMNMDNTKLQSVLSDTGCLFDLINGLFKSGNKNLVNKVLEKADIENILSVQGENITTYQGLFNYLFTPLKNAKDLDLYDIVKDDVDVKEIIANIAEKLSEDSTDGYSRILENIILPLYKIDGLRTKVFSKITEGSSESPIDFGVLDVETDGEYDFDKSYANWQNDTENLTAIIVEFFRTKVGTGADEKNLVKAVLIDGDDFGDVIKEVSTENLDKILKPVLYTLSTRGILQDALNEVAQNLDTVLNNGTETTLNLAGITLKKGDKEDQADEISKVITTIIDLFGSEAAQSMDTLNYEKVGILLDALKENACRIPLSPAGENHKTELGLFTDLFDNLLNKMFNIYPKAEEIIGTKPIYEINFTKLMKIVQDFKDAEADADSFINKLADIVVIPEGEEVTKEVIKELVEAIDSETIEEELETIDNLLDVIEDFEIDIIPEEVSTVVEANKEEIINTIDNNTSIPDDMKEKIKSILGIIPEEMLGE